MTKQFYLDEDFDELDNYELYWFFVVVIKNHVINDIVMDNIQRNIELLNQFHPLWWWLMMIVEGLNPFFNTMTIK